MSLRPPQARTSREIEDSPTMCLATLLDKGSSSSRKSLWDLLVLVDASTGRKLFEPRQLEGDLDMVYDQLLLLDPSNNNIPDDIVSKVIDSRDAGSLHFYITSKVQRLEEQRRLQAEARAQAAADKQRKIDAHK